MSFSISSKTQNILNIQEYRCPKCSLIPFINIFNKENKLFMSTKCTNNHNYLKFFDEMQIMSKTNPISNYCCNLCENRNNENKKILSNVFYYCSNCFKILCLKHGETHNLKDNHKIFLNKNLDSICTEHDGNTLVGYCFNHNKNYCLKCNHYIENNNNIEEELNDEQINLFENEMKQNENIINEIDLMFKKYKSLFNDLEQNFSTFKNNIVKKINFMNEIINFYKKKKK